MQTLLDQLSEIVGGVFSALSLEKNLGTVRLSDRPDLAQFQCNGALAAGKKLGKNPREIATQIVTDLSKNPTFSKVEAVGPGFINLNVTDDFLAAHLKTLAADPHATIPQTSAPETILLDYGGPNVAKPMHVGHLRTAIVGDTLRRLFAATGNKTIADIHLGDWGLQMGIVISEIARRMPDLPYFRAGFTGPFPSTPPVTFDDLSEIYPTAATACKDDEARAEVARIATFDLQKGHAGYRALWQQLRDLSVQAMQKNYAALNVHFDLWNGEASVDPLIAPMVDDLKKRNFAVESDGALIIPVARNDDKKEIPPLILVKRDGAALYATTDLATLVERARDINPARVIYIVDQRQGLHFEQVFRAARMAQIVSNQTGLDFAGIGTMNGTDGKPFKTRAGGVLKLEDLIQMATDKARAKIGEAHLAEGMGEAERDDIARKIAVAAIKFADLKNPRHVDYVFDLDAMTAFEGKTGPYLLYQAVRIGSILNKAADQNLKPADTFTLTDIDRPLALLLADYPNAVTGSIENLSAHILADYLYRLAQEFSGFYNRCHILSETDAALQGSRLVLCAFTRKTLETGLSLMGINVPARM